MSVFSYKNQWETEKIRRLFVASSHRGAPSLERSSRFKRAAHEMGASRAEEAAGGVSLGPGRAARDGRLES